MVLKHWSFISAVPFFLLLFMSFKKITSYQTREEAAGGKEVEQLVRHVQADCPKQCRLRNVEETFALLTSPVRRNIADVLSGRPAGGGRREIRHCQVRLAHNHLHKQRMARRAARQGFISANEKLAAAVRGK